LGGVEILFTYKKRPEVGLEPTQGSLDDEKQTVLPYETVDKSTTLDIFSRLKHCSQHKKGV